MKKNYFAKLLVLLALIAATPLHAQDWVSKMQDPNVNFYEVQQTFNEYHAAQLDAQARLLTTKPPGSELTTAEKRVAGYKQYKRWEWFMAPRVNPDGSRFNPMAVSNEARRLYGQYSRTTAGAWTLIGPATVTGMSGAGRLNFVKVHPNNPNTIFVGSPAGGLWVSTNGGSSWSTNTDWVDQVIGCTDIAFDPTNSNIMYLATGDGDAGDTYTIGLLKSTDGGLTWARTGLEFFTANYRQMSKVLVNPNNGNIITVATSGGLYRSTDGAVTFTQVQTGSYKDMEFKPGDPNTMYACGSSFVKSTNGGATWSTITSGLPAAALVSRMAIATTEADANYLYMIVGKPAPNYGTEGFYKSTNSGATWSKISTPDIGTQQWYDLCIASSPGNRDEVLIGGQTQFLKSTNAGVTWSNSGGGTHVDYHDVMYTNATTCYMANDGGVYKSTNAGGSWTNLSNGLTIAQMYGFGQSATNPNLLIHGWQDNGTNRYNGTNWNSILGGDGMLCFIDYNNDNNMWAESQNGGLARSTNGGGNMTSTKGNINETGAWVTPWLQDPNVPATVYAGFVNVWKSTVGGGTWTKISNFNTTATLNRLAVSEANSQVIWAANNASLFMTNDGGATWNTIGNVPSGTITYITCSNTDPNKAWITYSGFNNQNKVFQTNDQGNSWINISASLPNVPVNCIAYMKNSNDGIYVGTDLGVFYKDASLNTWQPFFDGLPNVIVTQLEIFYPGNKLRASTYGRGLWETPLYVAGSYPPAAFFISDQTISCPGAGVQFTDYSAAQPTGWTWSFPGGNPSSSTAQNPLVFYNTPGSFDVTLTVTNANGTDVFTANNQIIIVASPVAAPSTVGAQRCGPGTVNLSASTGATGTIRWWDAPGGGNMVATGTSYAPFISATTTYYVDVDPPPGLVDYVGETGISGAAGAYFTANDIRGLYFDVIDPVILNTVNVFANSDGNRTIEIIGPTGNTVAEKTVFIAASPNVATPVTLNFNLYPGTGYFIKCRGNVDLFRHSSGAVYPYTSGSINITESNASVPGYYYFFYDWNYTAVTCNSERAPVTATDTCAIIGINELFAGGAMDIYPNPCNGTFSVSFDVAQRDNYKVEILNAMGQAIYTEHLTHYQGKYHTDIDLGRKAKGMYVLRVSNATRSAVKKVAVY